MKYLLCLELLDLKIFTNLKDIKTGPAHKYSLIGNELVMKGLPLNHQSVDLINFCNVHDVLSVFNLYSPSLVW